MKKALLALALCLTVFVPAHAQISIRELFVVTEGKILDFAIGSSLDMGYFRDFIHGRNIVGGSFPILYVTPYLSLDLGYVTGYDPETRGAIATGATLRLNRIVEQVFPDQVHTIKEFLPGETWESLWFGPWVANELFTGEGFFDGTTLGGVKAGLSF